MKVDFHSHSTASDGELSPEALFSRGRDHGVDLMAITDHDSIDGYLAVRDLTRQCGSNSPQLISGIELSCVWSGVLIHIVGLGFDADNSALRESILRQQSARVERAGLIASKLEKLGFPGALAYVKKLAGDSQIGRPHFAQFLLDNGHVSSHKQAFKRYLGAGKPGDIKLTWPAMASVIEWLTDSGGTAVLAHPLHYKITATKLRGLIADFKSAGGVAIEVISGRQPQDRTRYLAQLSEQFGLLASVGSDFHRTGTPWQELGEVGQLPSMCKPVWSVLDFDRELRSVS